MIEQQVSSKLPAIEKRMLLIGRISECEARIHNGFRAGLNELNEITRGAKDDPEIRDFARSTLINTAEGYETYLQLARKSVGAMKPLEYLNHVMTQTSPGEAQPSDVAGVVQVIRKNQDLNSVAAATIAFRELTGEKIKMFDFAALDSWCKQHEPQCGGSK